MACARRCAGRLLLAGERELMTAGREGEGLCSGKVGVSLQHIRRVVLLDPVLPHGHDASRQRSQYETKLIFSRHGRRP